MSSTEVRLRRFDPSTIRPYSTILFAGGRRTGKSYAMRDFMWHLRDRIYETTVFSGTIDEDHPWERYTPEWLVHHCLVDFDYPALQRTLSNQESRKTLAAKYESDCPPAMLVFEDVEHLTPPIWKDQGMRSLIFNGRWSKSFCLVAFQYIMEVKMAMRGSFDYAVFAMENSAAVRDRIYKQFGGIFPTYDSFEAAFFACTSDYKVMVIDCRARSYNLEDVVFWYKASDHGFFSVSHPDVWRGPPPGSPAKSAKKKKSEDSEEEEGERIESTRKAGTTSILLLAPAGAKKRRSKKKRD